MVGDPPGFGSWKCRSPGNEDSLEKALLRVLERNSSLFKTVPSFRTTFGKTKLQGFLPKTPSLHPATYTFASILHTGNGHGSARRMFVTWSNESNESTCQCAKRAPYILITETQLVNYLSPLLTLSLLSDFISKRLPFGSVFRA